MEIRDGYLVTSSANHYNYAGITIAWFLFGDRGKAIHYMPKYLE